MWSKAELEAVRDTYQRSTVQMELLRQVHAKMEEQNESFLAVTPTDRVEARRLREIADDMYNILGMREPATIAGWIRGAIRELAEYRAKENHLSLIDVDISNRMPRDLCFIRHSDGSPAATITVAPGGSFTIQFPSKP